MIALVLLSVALFGAGIYYFWFTPAKRMRRKIDKMERQKMQEWEERFGSPARERVLKALRNYPFRVGRLEFIPSAGCNIDVSLNGSVEYVIFIHPKLDYFKDLRGVDIALVDGRGGEYACSLDIIAGLNHELDRWIKRDLVPERATVIVD